MSIFKKAADKLSGLPLVKAPEKKRIDWGSSLRESYRSSGYPTLHDFNFMWSYVGQLSHETEFKYLVSRGYGLELFDAYGLAQDGHTQIENYTRLWYIDSFGEVQYTDNPDRQKKLATFYTTEAEAKKAAGVS